MASSQDTIAANEESFLLTHAIAEVERLQELDRLVPSYHNVITLASLDFQVAMMLANLKPRDLQLFFVYTRQGNFTPVRIAALNCLLLVGTWTIASLRATASRSCVSMRMHSQASPGAISVRGLAVGMSTGVFGGGGLRGPEALLIEEDSGHVNAAEKARDAQLEAMLKTLKKELAVRLVCVRASSRLCSHLALMLKHAGHC